MSIAFLQKELVTNWTEYELFFSLTRFRKRAWKMSKLLSTLEKDIDLFWNKRMWIWIIRIYKKRDCLHFHELECIMKFLLEKNANGLTILLKPQVSYNWLWNFEIFLFIQGNLSIFSVKVDIYFILNIRKNQYLITFYGCSMPKINDAIH